MCLKLKKRKRYHVKKRKLKEIQKELGNFSQLIPDKATLEVLETDEVDLILVNGQPLLMIIEGKAMPTLKGALEMDIQDKYVVVDKGAVRYVINGADIMSPGIIEADPNIRRDDLVIILEETHRKPLAIGRSLLNGDEMVENMKGKAVKSLHYVGDKIWNFEF